MNYSYFKGEVFRILAAQQFELSRCDNIYRLDQIITNLLKGLTDIGIDVEQVIRDLEAM